MTGTVENMETDADTPKKKSKKGLLIGVLLALVLGGGGFFATYSGFVGATASPTDIAKQEAPVADLPTLAFIELEPLVISLGSTTGSRHLRFRGSLEIVPSYEADVTYVLPRVIDVLNSYLRAVDLTVLEDPAALIKLRAQMLRRIQLVTGEGRVRDLLILEFVLN
ncbi:flagellar basal body-associated FliL family protein [Aliiroseovarius sediminis]|uniref:flagellar basal body-associated FliL family protein n=1 Tax=Aliiroseovarius sediminis TaxID=2925839 RepID=UPI001F560971|nr:flagellar basal body-associated FliL family protein [Aliiroseovarius sediminis]MCI2395295.1 flagellar basal body-associated FliL family protein [Aliiroseovarius sediminis]